MKKIALFDWDKTIRKGGYVLFDFMNILVKDNIIDGNIVGEIEDILKQHADGDLTYTEFAKEAIQIYGTYIEGIPVQELEPALKEFEELENKNNKIYPIMEEKIFPFLLENGIQPVIISGSQQEPIDLYKKRMGFERAFGVQYKIRDGKYEQECLVNTAIGDGKSIIIQELLRREPQTQILFGFGDSEADVPMLKVAKQGFINNSKRFLEQDNIHYFDFTLEKAGEQIIELMAKSLEKERRLEVEGR